LLILMFLISKLEPKTLKIYSNGKNIAPHFGGITWDIKAPESFEIEQISRGLNIPVMHDDQHRTYAILRSTFKCIRASRKK
jgi:malic enzyme